MSVSDISKISAEAGADRLRGRELAPQVVIDVPMSSQRSLSTVTAEIRTLQDASRRVVLGYSVEIGRRLVEAKGMVERGDWGRYLREELRFSQSTANNHMRIFESYGAAQISLTGAEVNNQAFADLDYSKALALLALPSEEERAAFVEEHDMARLSTRELREELRRREEDGSPPHPSPAATPSPQGEGFGGQIARATAGDAERAANDRPYGSQDGGARRQTQEEIEADRELRLELIRANSRAKDAEAERDRILRETEESREKLDAAKAERDAARQASAEAERKAQAASQARDKALQASAAAEERAAQAGKKMLRLQEELQEARQAKELAQMELDAAKAAPQVDQATLDKLLQEAEAKAEAARKAKESQELKDAKKSYREAEKQASVLRKEAGDAKQAAEQAQKEAQEAKQAKEAADQQCSSLQQEKEELEKKLRLAAPELAEFKVIFSQVQEALNRCVDVALNLPPDKVENGVSALKRLLAIIGERISKERWESFPE